MRESGVATGFRNWRSGQKRQVSDLPLIHKSIPNLNVVDLEMAMRKLERRNARLARIVEARFYAGFSREEAANLLDISPATLDRDWLRAKTHLLLSLEAV